MRLSTAFVLLGLFMTGSQVLATPLVNIFWSLALPFHATNSSFEYDKFFGASTVEARAFDFDDLDIRDFSEALLEARDDVSERNWPDFESDLVERYLAVFGAELEGREDEVSSC
jgi:hypothetical protein